ncbi:cytochrome-c peroxidase [Kordiimonas aestuarii]|uniref:cytochrome-c peroxidase n=1 Tax=Kordiimonas aestuarii TaxID=1005925 RepID=UPI0021D3A8B2|nr:cytochrome c peroxidase [Kordiimonas aestuarii]
MYLSLKLLAFVGVLTSGSAIAAIEQADVPLGLPPVPVPEHNPVTPEKIALGETLFNDTRFSSTGDVSCATCHDPQKAFTDSPLLVSEGIEKKKGTRNAPTVLNSAYMETMFWDGREPDLEAQSQGPFINPVEMALESHDPIVAIARTDEHYQEMFAKAFGVKPEEITIDHVSQAIASFERTIISGNSPFDQWYFGGDEAAVSEDVKRGLEVFTGKGRCVSCHTMSQNFALFSDSKFHNLNVSFDKISTGLESIAKSAKNRQMSGEELDVTVLTDASVSELGRFAVNNEWANTGAFKTPTLRNISVTAPYMHDGSVETLEDVVIFYNNGGRVNEDDPINDFQSGGIRPLDLTDQEQKDLVAFLEALTSPEFAKQ